MKTFKMMAFDMKTAEGTQKFPLIDGIVINQENSHQLWILELFLPATYRSLFEESMFTFLRPRSENSLSAVSIMRFLVFSLLM